MKENNNKEPTFLQLKWDMLQDECFPEELWHYTSARGLNGIVRRNGKLAFFFTRSDCLNDYSEGNDFLR